MTWSACCLKNQKATAARATPPVVPMARGRKRWRRLGFFGSSAFTRRSLLRVPRQHDEARFDGCMAPFSVVIDGVGPGDDGAFAAEEARVGEGGAEEAMADASAARGVRDAGRTEEPEAAVVAVVRRGAFDRAAGLADEERRLLTSGPLP